MSHRSKKRSLALGTRAARGTVSMPLLLALAHCGGRYELGEVQPLEPGAASGSAGSAQGTFEPSGTDKIGHVIIDELTDLDAPLSQYPRGSVGDVDGDGYDDWLAEVANGETLVPNEYDLRLVHGGPRVAGDLYRDDRLGPVVTYESFVFSNSRPLAAGDLDGDGFGDLLYVADGWGSHLPTDPGQSSGFSPGLHFLNHWDEQRAYVLYGGPRAASTSRIRLTEVAVPFVPDPAIQASFRPELDLQTDPEAEGWDVQTLTHLGRLGDLDSDGFDDLAYTYAIIWRGEKVVGDSVVETSSRTDAITYVFYGAADRLSMQSPLASAAAVLPGVTSIDRLGDVDGDGYPDLVAKKNRQAYVMPGGNARLTGTIAPEQVGTALIPADSDQPVGYQVLREITSVGDLDADGFDDLMVMRWGPLGNATFLFYGGAHRLEQPWLDDSADATFLLEGDGQAGLYIQRLGDWNGDGREDLMVANNAYPVTGEDIDQNRRRAAVVIPARAKRYSGALSVDMLAAAPDDRTLTGDMLLMPLGDVDGDSRVDLCVTISGEGTFVKYGGPFESIIR
jgi:hypothetical protein